MPMLIFFPLYCSCTMMSETALRDLNLLPKSETTNDSSTKDVLAKPFVEQTNEKVGGKQRKSIISLDEPTANGTEIESSSAEGVAAEVEYIESEKLDDLEDVDKSLRILLANLETKDWVLLCETLNNVRRFSIYHKETLQEILENVISLLVKTLKNPRSAVCKTAIMTCEDIFKAFGDQIIDSLDPMLVQLLLKSSQDKRFVCEVAEKALITLTIWVSPVLLLPKLQPYFKNRNPRIRAKASMCFSRSVQRLILLRQYNIVCNILPSKHLAGCRGNQRIRNRQTDQNSFIPAERPAPRVPRSCSCPSLGTTNRIRKISRFPPVLPPVLPVEQDGVSSEQPQVLSWEQFCESNLPKLSAQAVLRVTTTLRESPVSGL
ncbi:hypothetical protein OSB04_007723 [Centaurea solstitialis]|uniref:TOG domain-containing protein n=1 Tax=Centaurea solstitialis TaxID=347529 RepID=A0AA38TSZ0_9ASTR|nr:hypothetical protein OSB04_007723 [Centaurea solstitialis]